MIAAEQKKMQLYRYEAVDPVTKKVRRAIRRAYGEQDVADHIVARGLTISDIGPAGSWREYFASWFKPKREDVEGFYRDFSLMVGAGATDYQQIFSALAKPMRDRRFAEVIDAIGHEATQNSSIADEMERHPWAFASSQIALIRAGQQGVGLEKVATDIADTIQEQIELDEDRSSALQEGKIAAVTLLVVLYAIFSYVVPQLVGIFSGPGKIMPPLLVPLAAVSAFVKLWFVQAILGIVIVAITYPPLLKLLPLERAGANVRVDEFLLRIPLFGEIDRWITQGMFASTLGMLLKHTANPKEALKLSIPVTGRPAYIARLKEIVEPFGESVPLSSLLRETGLFDDVFLVPLATAESGNLDLGVRLQLIGKKLRERAARRLRKVSRPLGAAVQYLIGGIGIAMAVLMGILVYQTYVSTSVGR